METHTKESYLPKVCESVYYCLAYFDIFRHPLTLAEITAFTPHDASAEQVEDVVNRLVESGSITLANRYYYISDSPVDVSKRIIAEKRAIDHIEDAKRYGKLIGSFPFVLSVYISGSLSKGVLHDDGDYDFFLVVKQNRLWLAKLLLKLYKVVFLKNSYEHFCINYLITNDNLEIEEQNIFTATELLTIIPVAGTQSLFDELKEANPWVTHYLPNKEWVHFQEYISPKRRFSRLTQLLLDNPLGNVVDHIIMSISIFYNKVKYRNLADKSIFDLAFKSKKQTAKVHPNNTQKRVLEAYAKKIDQYVCPYS